MSGSGPKEGLTTSHDLWFNVCMTTTTEFRRLAEKRFRDHNNNNADEILVTWEFVSDGFVPDRIGNGATMHGNFIARAEGFRPRRIMATMALGAADVSLR